MNRIQKSLPESPRNRTGGTRRKSAGGTLLGLFIGLVIGLLIALGVVWYIHKSPLPFENKTEPAPGAAREKSNGLPAEPALLPGKPGDKPRERQKLEFYDILEGKQQPTPGNASGTVTVTPATPPTAAGAASSAPTETKPATLFFLQAGAFQKTQDADNLKARLALMGLDASVQAVAVADKGTMQRVRVGPFRSPEEMNRARTVLAQAGIQTTVVRQKE
jgi:cell division protein FtsN